MNLYDRIRNKIIAYRNKIEGVVDVEPKSYNVITKDVKQRYQKQTIYYGYKNKAYYENEMEYGIFTHKYEYNYKLERERFK